MNRVATMALAGLLLACSATPRADVDKQARAFIRSAAIADTTSLRRLAADSEPVVQVLAIHQLDPQLLRDADDGLTFVNGSVSGDTARYFYSIAGRKQSDLLALGFLQKQGIWLIYHFGLPNRD